ncbi:uncharacterized protein LOC111335917 [Stylophora pistillata]|uniref:uncharacterized protein LOC111335917 n=1 Tax=Stylophora pistillata TaxID=50429 RepID=UPI000C039EE6|nr:uncharacterized protein LOC111335917 [Stylophora pistillata]
MSDMDQDTCEWQCYLDHNCVSINLQFEGTQKNCELNNSTHYEHHEDLIAAHDHFYRGTENACGGSPCKNNATCQSGFTSKRYHCLCAPGFIGHNCGLEFSINSVILLNNEDYLSHLHQFLVPAVGNASHWLLCYRASRDSHIDQDFRDQCKGKKDTITIVKENGFVFGGYVDIPWVSTRKFQYGETPNAFIFSLHNSEHCGAFKSTIKNPERAIFDHIYLRPTFGTDDIRIDRNDHLQSVANFSNDYFLPSKVTIQNPQTILAGVLHFKPDEVEVFYLEKKTQP